jgi:hypothetical protein
VVADGATEAVGGTDGASVDFLTGIEEGLIGLTCDTVIIGDRALEAVLLARTTGFFVKFVFVDCASVGRRIA